MKRFILSAILIISVLISTASVVFAIDIDEPLKPIIVNQEQTISQ